MKVALVALIAALTTTSAQAPLSYSVRRAGAVHVDGIISDSEWGRAAWTSDFVDIEGAAKPRPLLRTRAKLLWDDAYLYIAAELTEPHVWGTLMERDAVIYRDNDFEVFIDPDGDTFDYYELEINALGTVWDLFLTKPYRDNGHAINAWDIRGLQSAVHINGTLNNPADQDTSWTIELALPWSVLKEAAPEHRAPVAGDEWRLNFSRVEWDVVARAGTYVKERRPEHNWVWSPQGTINMHAPEKWGRIHFEQ